MCLFLNKQYSFKISYLTSVPVYTMLTYTHSRSPTTDPCISRPERWSCRTEKQQSQREERERDDVSIKSSWCCFSLCSQGKSLLLLLLSKWAQVQQGICTQATACLRSIKKKCSGKQLIGIKAQSGSWLMKARAKTLHQLISFISYGYCLSGLMCLSMRSAHWLKTTSGNQCSNEVFVFEICSIYISNSR